MMNFSLRFFYVLALAAVPVWGFAIDIPPGQAIAPPPGKSAIRFEMNSVKFADKYLKGCLLYTSPSPRDRQKSRMPSSA